MSVDSYFFARASKEQRKKGKEKGGVRKRERGAEAEATGDRSTKKSRRLSLRHGAVCPLPSLPGGAREQLGVGGESGDSCC